jgi:integration host factor subunit beta
MRKSFCKKEIIEKLSKTQSIDIDKSEKAVKQILETMKVSLSNNDRIEIRGFGSFQVKEYAPRKAINPKTGESVNLNTQYQIQFKAGEPLRKKVNKSNPS